MSKILFLDADDVLYRTVETFCTQYSAMAKTDFTINQVTEYNFYNLVEHPTYVDIILRNPNFFENLPLKGKNIPEIVQELTEAYDLYIVTAAHPQAMTGKLNAFIRDFPFLNVNQLVFTWDKFLLKGDYMIDDALHNLLGFKETNKNGKNFCVNMPHNKGVNDKIDYRIDTLEEIGMYLL